MGHRDDFRQYIDSVRIAGVHGSFVPYKSLEKYWTYERIRSALAGQNSAEEPLPDLQGSLRVFSILILTGNIDAIPSFSDLKLSDDCLPFRKREDIIETWPLDELGLDSLDVMVIWNLQWQFCAAEFSEAMANRTIHFDDMMILPIVEKTTLKPGDFHSTYRIKVHPDYNSLRLPVGLSISLVFRSITLNSVEWFAATGILRAQGMFDGI